MQEQELKEIVEEMVRKLTNKASHTPSNPQTLNIQTAEVAPTPISSAETALPDITKTDLKQQYLVKNPCNKTAFLEMKHKTPARIGIGKAGARYKTETMLRVRADHAAAQDSVFSDVSKDFIKRQGYVALQTQCTSKDEYITRPDKGRRFTDEQLAVLQNTIPKQSKVVLVVGDGLSSAAVEANAAEIIPAIQQVLSANGISVPPILFVKYCRVGASDAIGEVTDCAVLCMLVGERPGLVTAESMSAYITYCPKHGIPESKRTVVSNIHRGGTPPVEAGAHVGELILKILDKKASGVDLK